MSHGRRTYVKLNFDRRWEPGAFHGVRQHTAVLFENKFDWYPSVLGGQTVGKLYKVWPCLRDDGPKEGLQVGSRGVIPSTH